MRVLRCMILPGSAPPRRRIALLVGGEATQSWMASRPGCGADVFAVVVERYRRPTIRNVFISSFPSWQSLATACGVVGRDELVAGQRGIEKNLQRAGLEELGVEQHLALLFSQRCAPRAVRNDSGRSGTGAWALAGPAGAPIADGFPRYDEIGAGLWHKASDMC